jgi:transcriptional regulator with XRE-family HTH domain
VDFGRLLRLARRRAGLSQRQLAERTGVAQPTIARIELGVAVPRVDTLDRLLGACGETLEVMRREAVDFDRTLIRRLLAMTPEERVACLIEEAATLRRLDEAHPVGRRGL